MSENKKMPLGALIQILLDTLKKKTDILNAIELKCNEQAKLLADRECSMEEIDRTMDEKSELIDQLTKLDAGFETLYGKIREEIMQNKDVYKEEIREIQKSISVIMEKSASIEVLESRNKLAIESLFRNRKKELQHKKTASSVARRYYNTAKNLNAVNPQFMDKKK